MDEYSDLDFEPMLEQIRAGFMQVLAENDKLNPDQVARISDSITPWDYEVTDSESGEVRAPSAPFLDSRAS